MDVKVYESGTGHFQGVLQTPEVSSISCSRGSEGIIPKFYLNVVQNQSSLVLIFGSGA